MAVNSADKKPEKYVGPDGKARIRMVPVDKEVVKTEAKDGDGVNIVKDRPFKGKPMKKEPSTDVGIKFSDMRKSKWAKDADANPHRAKPMGEAYEPEPPSPDEKSMAMRQAKFIQYVGEELMEYMEQEKDFPEWMQNKLSELHQSAKDMHGVLAGEYEDDDEEEMDESTKIDEVLDRPGALDSYRKKAKTQSDKARNSATAKIVRGNPDISKEKDVIRKREKGLDKVDRAANRHFRKSLGLGYSGKKEGYSPDLDPDVQKKKMISKSDKDKLSAVHKMLQKEKQPNKENYVSAAQRKAVWANRADGGKGHPDNKGKK